MESSGLHSNRKQGGFSGGNNPGGFAARAAIPQSGPPPGRLDFLVFANTANSLLGERNPLKTIQQELQTWFATVQQYFQPQGHQANLDVYTGRLNQFKSAIESVNAPQSGTRFDQVR